MPRTCCVMQNYKTMKKVIINIVLIIVFALPCAWLASESITLQLLGLVYTIEYYKGFIHPIVKRIGSVS